MRVVHYHPRALVGDGGVSNSVRHLSRSLTRAGADAVIAYDAADGPPPVDDAVRWVGVRHVGTASARVPTDLGQVLAPDGVLVLNSAWTLHNARAGALARRAGMPYVLAARGAYDPLILQRRRWVKRSWWWAAERRLVQQAAALHVFFDEQSQHVRNLGYHGAVLVAPNGITVPDDARWDGGSGGYVLYLGRFDPEHKGLDLLLRAVAELPEHDRPDVVLAGPDWKGGTEVVVSLIAELGLGRWVTIRPAVYGADKWALLGRARAFVYPSRWEGFGNSLAEAAVLGVPSLATPYPLAQSLAARGAALVRNPTPRALAEGLVEVTQHPNSDAERAAGIRDEFSWDSVARRWLEQAAALP